MRIVHLADSHLGFSSYSRVDKYGRNLVEEMVYKGFEQAIDRIIQLQPDAVVHAGDVFHHVRPRIRPLFVFKRGLERLFEAGIPMIVISGNHDAPKGYSATSPFFIYEGPRDLHIAHRYQYERFEVETTPSIAFLSAWIRRITRTSSARSRARAEMSWSCTAWWSRLGIGR